MNRESAYLLKQDEVYSKKRKELELLRKELDDYRKSLSNGLVDSKVAQYNLDISKLSRLYYSVLLSRFLDLNDSSMAIAYFISSVTGKRYDVYEYETILYEPTYPSIMKKNYSRPKPIRYNICFLASSDSVDKAYSELNNKFMVRNVNSYDSYYKVKDGLRDVSDNYILLAYYKGSMKGKRIEYPYDNFVSVNNEPDSFIVSQLKDKRFSYILDFIDKVIEYKLDSPDLSVTLSDMKMIADSMDGKILKK